MRQGGAKNGIKSGAYTLVCEHFDEIFRSRLATIANSNEEAVLLGGSMEDSELVYRGVLRALLLFALCVIFSVLTITARAIVHDLSFISNAIRPEVGVIAQYILAGLTFAGVAGFVGNAGFLVRDILQQTHQTQREEQIRLIDETVHRIREQIAINSRRHQSEAQLPREVVIPDTGNSDENQNLTPDIPDERHLFLSP